MSLADEVLAKHKLCDGCVTGCGRHCRTCQHFWSNEWPCESVRLALSLQAAEQVVEAARRVYRKGDNLTRALDEYDKGGQG